MVFDLQQFANTTTAKMDVSYDKDADVLTLGAATKTEYTYDAVNAKVGIATTATSHLGFAPTGNGIALAMSVKSSVNVPASSAIFYLNVKDGVSVPAAGSGDVAYDELHILSDITDFGFNVNNADVKTVDLGGNAAVVSLTSAANTVALTAKGSKEAGEQAVFFNNANEITLNADENSTIADGSYFTVENGAKKAVLSGGTMLEKVDISGSASSDLKFSVANGANNIKLNFGEGTTGANVTFAGKAKITSSLDDAKGVVFDLGNNTSQVAFESVEDSELSIISAVKGANVSIVSADTDSSIMITATSDATLAFSGKGVETVGVDYLKASAVTVNNWLFAKGADSVKYNAVDTGTFSLQSITGAFKTNGLELGVGSSKVIIAKDSSNSVPKNIAGVSIKNESGSYNALIAGNSALKASDGFNLKNFDAFIGEGTNTVLDLGDVTDKKVVYLNNKVGGDSWGEWAIYNNITQVKTSSAGGTLLISDMPDKQTSLYGAGAEDSLFSGGGGTASSDMVDTLGSAQGKRGWFGSAEYSGHDVVIIRDSANTATNNFDFADEVASEKESDVLALMHGAGYITYDSGTSGTNASVNFCIGADSLNYMEFRNIGNANVATNSHDFYYTYNLGKSTSKGRVDLTNDATKGTLSYSSDVEFYLGQGDTTLKLSATDSNQKLNYAGGGVMMYIANIDGSNAGEGNILNGENHSSQTITASSRYATTVCGGLGSNNYDSGADTLVGGKNTTFWVGANMGNDKIQNLDTGDTVVFLGSKWADVTGFNSDAESVTVSFNAASGGSTIAMSTASTGALSKVTNLTCEFDDCAWTWNGSNWTQTLKS